MWMQNQEVEVLVEAVAASDQVLQVEAVVLDLRSLDQAILQGLRPLSRNILQVRLRLLSRNILQVRQVQKVILRNTLQVRRPDQVLLLDQALRRLQVKQRQIRRQQVNVVINRQSKLPHRHVQIMWQKVVKQ